MPMPEMSGLGLMHCDGDMMGVNTVTLRYNMRSRVLRIILFDRFLPHLAELKLPHHVLFTGTKTARFIEISIYFVRCSAGPISRSLCHYSLVAMIRPNGYTV
jgi:hypothetical protein